jgi:hypothetical protein
MITKKNITFYRKKTQGLKCKKKQIQKLFEIKNSNQKNKNHIEKMKKNL